MNLKALFNFNYFKENLKKSKGLLAFFFGIVPLLNIVMLTTKGELLASFNDISAITIVGLYIVPIILAISLMGFLFSKKSTDFVMSKPLSRKTIYMTNVIGGILILLFLILINTIIFGLVGLFFSKIIIPFGLLVDYFLYWSVSYIFIFAVTMLAITIAGNSIGTFILIFLIVCLVPFFSFAKYVFSDYPNNDNYIKCTTDTCKPEKYDCYNDTMCENELKNNNYILQYNEAYGNSFTAPLSFLNAHQDTIYNEASIIKMSILSIIYFIISFFTFKIRKMENNEISFHSELMHYFIKTLVFIPIGFVCYAIMYDGGNGSILIAIAGALIYYIVYDLITRKNIFKLRKSLIICFISFAFITGSFYLYHKSIEDKHIYLENIEKISFYHAGEYLNISDAKIINEIIKASVNNNGYMSGRIAIFEKNHKYYSTYININENLNKTINQYILKRNISLATTYNYNSIDSVSHKIPLTKEFKKLAKDTMSYLKIDDLRNASKTISVYDYSNHAYQKLIIPYTLNEELDKYVLTSFNNRFIDFVSDYNNKNSINFVIESSLFNSQESYVFNYVINSNLSSFIDYIKENNYKTIDKEICCIYYNGNTVLEIGDAKKLYDEFKKYEDKVKNTLEYQSIVKKFNEVYSNTDYEY